MTSHVPSRFTAQALAVLSVPGFLYEALHQLEITPPGFAALKGLAEQFNLTPYFEELSRSAFWVSGTLLVLAYMSKTRPFVVRPEKDAPGEAKELKRWKRLKLRTLFYRLFTFVGVIALAAGLAAVVMLPSDSELANMTPLAFMGAFALLAIAAYKRKSAMMANAVKPIDYMSMPSFSASGASADLPTDHGEPAPMTWGQDPAGTDPYSPGHNPAAGPANPWGAPLASPYPDLSNPASPYPQQRPYGQ